MKAILFLGMIMLLSTTTFASGDDWYYSRYAQYLSRLHLSSGEKMAPIQKYEFAGTFKETKTPGVLFMFQPRIYLIKPHLRNLFSGTTIEIGSISIFADEEFRNIGERICKKSGLKYLNHTTGRLFYRSVALVDGDNLLFVRSTAKYGTYGYILYGVYCQK